MGTAAKELPACPVETTLMLISDKWKVLILRDLLPGTKRFGELKKSIGYFQYSVSNITRKEVFLLNKIYRILSIFSFRYYQTDFFPPPCLFLLNIISFFLFDRR